MARRHLRSYSSTKLCTNFPSFQCVGLTQILRLFVGYLGYYWELSVPYKVVGRLRGSPAAAQYGYSRLWCISTPSCWCNKTQNFPSFQCSGLTQILRLFVGYFRFIWELSETCKVIWVLGWEYSAAAEIYGATTPGVQLCCANANDDDASHKFCDYLWAILGLSENYQKPARYLSPWLGNILQQQEYIVQQLQVFSCAVQMQLAAMPHTNFAIICGLF